jgi:hypothetical protein
LSQGAAASVFFWTYMLLVFLVLLNFLLAIIVDAFSAVGRREGGAGDSALQQATKPSQTQRLLDQP